ncbi:DUF1294 domain-containing protein [Candidatus Gracilibacteria bacterium]|nr:DUF1294 domain-containing protein [Candidatus Gracilibacteria bacterium]
MSLLIFYLLILNLLAYSIMWIDKMKAIYNFWRISEKTLWIIAILGGSFGIWLGMMGPLYHKAGKKNFRFWIPMISAFWVFLILFMSF